MSSKASKMQDYYLNTTLEASNMNSLSAEAAVYSSLINSMKTNVDKVYGDSLVYQSIQIPDVNSTNVLYVSYLKVCASNHRGAGKHF